MKTPRPLVLLILDGWGIGEDDAHNAIFQANTPTIDHLLERYPNGPIGAAGEHIGLAPGHQGSTEMGHLIISAGRNVRVAQMQMQEALETDQIKQNKAYVEAIEKAREKNTRLHLMGLLSDAGVHSYADTCYKLLQMAAAAGLKKDQVFIHIFSDGRDTPPNSLPQFVKTLEENIQSSGVGIIASLQGRYWAMDRDHRWERVESAYQLLTEGRGVREAKSISGAIAQARAEKETDEFISPTMIAADGFFEDGDAVINWNYRVDREIEITKALIEPKFEGFERGVIRNIHYVATLPYYEGIPSPYAFEREEQTMKNILPAVIAEAGLSQYRITETEKWVYLTKIFNAMHEEAFDGEERKMIESDKVATYDEKPEMQAEAIANDVADHLAAGDYDTYFLNICNADILGHTGNHDATIIGCEAIDRAIKTIYEEVIKQNGILLITADHGDAEIMWDMHNDLPHTQHTDSFVPFILVDEKRKNNKIRETGALRDVAPTILELLNLPKPPQMDGSSLIISNE